MQLRRYQHSMLHIGTDNPYLVTGPGAWTVEGGVNEKSAALHHLWGSLMRKSQDYHRCGPRTVAAAGQPVKRMTTC